MPRDHSTPTIADLFLEHQRCNASHGTEAANAVAGRRMAEIEDEMATISAESLSDVILKVEAVKFHVDGLGEIPLLASIRNDLDALAAAGPSRTGGDGRPAKAERLEAWIGNFAERLETFQCRIGTYARCANALGAALDAAESRDLCSMTYAVASTLGSLSDDVDKLVADIYRIRRAAAGGAA